jgi:hypothetical protein
VCAPLRRYLRISRQAAVQVVGLAHLLVAQQAVPVLLLTRSPARCKVHCRQQSSLVLAEAEGWGLQLDWLSAIRRRSGNGAVVLSGCCIMFTLSNLTVICEVNAHIVP